MNIKKSNIITAVLCAAALSVSSFYSGYAAGTDSFLFVEAEDARERYAIPSAFAAYAGYMNLRLGKDGFLKEGAGA